MNPDINQDNLNQDSPINLNENEKPKSKFKNKKLLLLIPVLLVVGLAVFFVLKKDKEPIIPPDVKPIVNKVYKTELEKVDLRKTKVTDGSVVVYAKETKRYVEVPSNNSKSVMANMIKKDDSVKLDYDKLTDELISKYLASYDEVKETDKLLAKRQERKFTKGDEICKFYLSTSGLYGPDANKIEKELNPTANEQKEYPGYFYVDCIDTKDISAAAKFVEPFYKAYFASNKAYGGDEGGTLISVNKKDIKDSSVKGYQYAQGSLGCVDLCGGAGGYFAKSESSNWQFVTGSQEGLYCDVLDSSLKQKAFADEKCMFVEKGKDSAIEVKVKDHFKL